MSSEIELDGPSDGQPILFLHGTRLSRTVWRPVMRRLAGSYRVIAIDLPGHGSSAEVPFTMDRAVDAAVAAIQREGAGRVVLVGLSLGGYVAMEVAARHPERVRALVLSGSSQDPTGFWSIGFRVLRTLLRRAPLRPTDAINRWAFSRRYPRDVADAVISGGFWSRGGSLALDSLIGRPFARVLAAFGGPTLLINGEYDVLFRMGERRYLAATADGRRVVLRGATHLTILDRPDAFAAAVRRFVQALPPDTG